MFLQENNINDYLTSTSTALTRFDIMYLEGDIERTQTLKGSRVADVWCYRSGVHEFLLFHLESPTPEKKFWMRLDRMPGIIRGILRVSQRAPANDTYCMNLDRDKLLVEGDEAPELIEGLTDLSPPPSMRDIALLMNVIQEVSRTWELFRTNCRWFCAVSLDSLQHHFGGKWMTAKFHRGLANFRGFDSDATRKVRELYQPRFEPGLNMRTMGHAILAGE